MGHETLADAVASGALDLDAAREATLELREKRERAEKRLQAMSAGVELGVEVGNALAAVQGSLATVLAGMERERLRALVQLVLRRFSVEGYGGPRNRKGRVTAYEFTPEFQQFWLAHSQRVVGQAEYFRNLGFSIYRVAQRGFFDSVTARAALEFRAPARVDDVLDLYVRVSHIGNTSLRLDVEIYPDSSETLLTTIQAVYVGFHIESGGTRPVPGEVRELVQHFEAAGEVLPLDRFPRLAAAAR